MRNNHLEDLNSKLLECEFHVNPLETSMQLPAAIVQHVSSTDDAIFFKECTPKTYRHRIIFMGMMNELAVTDMPHRSDEPNHQNATITSDHAVCYRPGCWIFVAPGSDSR